MCKIYANWDGAIAWFLDIFGTDWRINWGSPVFCLFSFFGMVMWCTVFTKVILLWYRWLVMKNFLWQDFGNCIHVHLSCAPAKYLQSSGIPMIWRQKLQIKWKIWITKHPWSQWWWKLNIYGCHRETTKTNP